MKSQAGKSPSPARIRRSRMKKENGSGESSSSPSLLNKVVKTTRMKGDYGNNTLKFTGQKSIKSYLEQNVMEQSEQFSYKNPGIHMKIRDQRTNIVCSDASDLMTTEAITSKFSEADSASADTKATDRNRNL